MCMAFDGSEEAKRAMAESYTPGPSQGEAIGIDFLQMDGIKGLLFVAEKPGALLMAKPDGVDVGYLLSQSLEICGEQPTRRCAARSRNYECLYRKNCRLVAEGVQHRRDTTPSRLSQIASLRYEELFNETPISKTYLLSKWGEKANDEELELAATGLIRAKDPKQQLAHLRIFARRPFSTGCGSTRGFAKRLKRIVMDSA